MNSSPFKVGITRDTLRADGTSIFDKKALQIFDAAKLQWEFLPDNVTELTAAHGVTYDALCVLNPKVPEAVVAGPNQRVRIVARMGVGYDAVDVKACTAHGVILTNTPNGVRRPVATSILALILALSHKLLTKDRITREGRWAETTNYMGVGLTGKTVGSIGVGNIGGELFRLLAPLEMVHLASRPVREGRGGGETARPAHRQGISLPRIGFRLRQHAADAGNARVRRARDFSLMKPTASSSTLRAGQWSMSPPFTQHSPNGASRAPRSTCSRRSRLARTTRCWRSTTSS